MARHRIPARPDAERCRLAPRGAGIRARPSGTRLDAAHGPQHRVAWPLLTTDDADATIADEIAHHRQLSVGFEWKVYAYDGPPDLLDRLARHGFTVGPCEAVMVRDLADAPPWLGDATGPVVHRVDSAARIAD